MCVCVCVCVCVTHQKSYLTAVCVMCIYSGQIWTIARETKSLCWHHSNNPSGLMISWQEKWTISNPITLVNYIHLQMDLRTHLLPVTISNIQTGWVDWLATLIGSLALCFCNLKSSLNMFSKLVIGTAESYIQCTHGFNELVWYIDRSPDSMWWFQIVTIPIDNCT